MPPRVWLAIAKSALLALAGEVLLSFPLAFNPGWANRWPFGLTIYCVWSTGMSVVFFVILMTTAVGSGAVLGAACSHFGVGHRHGRAVYGAWLACSFVLALLAGLRAFSGIYASTLEMWPNGYNPAE